MTWAANGREPLNHYGLVTLGNPTVEKELSVRFKGNGKPVFLVHDLKLGISVGDVVRFSDKAVLVDAAVLQTLQATGALKNVNQAAVLRLQARAQSGIWKGRNGMVSSSRERKGYALGSELLKIFEDYFGGAPSNEELVIRFDGRDMVLMVPDAMLDRLSFAQVRKVPPSGKPLVVSEVPAPRRFQGETMRWQVWGADPSEPEAQLQYGIEGELAPGLSWNGAEHTVEGVCDSPGTFAWKAWVRNPGGATDTLDVMLDVRVNQPPRIAEAVAAPVVAGSAWSLSPVLWDPDHPSESLACRADSLPAGATLDPLTCRIDWQVGDSVHADSLPQILLTVCDPLQACAESPVRLRTVGPTPSRLSAIRFILPEDSLLQGRMRHWPVAALVTPGITLLDMRCQDSCGVVPGAGDEGFFWMLPLQAGPQTLTFRLAEGSDTVSLTQNIEVKPNKPPMILSALSAYRVQEGHPLAYTPVAVDPDGDSIRWSLQTADHRRIRYQGGELPLWTSSPGTYTLEFIASDGFNPPARQRIAYEVEPLRSEWKGLGVRYMAMGPVSSWWAYWRLGSARFGLFTPKLSEVLDASTAGVQEWPYVFAGASFTGSQALASGSHLWLDMGLQIRRPTAKLWSGSVMFNAEGRYASQNKKYPWAFEFELSVHANQAILVVDTAGWSEIDYTVVVDNGGTVSADDLDPDSLISAYLGPSYDKLVKDATARDNMVGSLRLETWFPVLDMSALGDLFAAPVYWREEYVMRAESHQLAGLGLRQQWSWQGMGFTQSLRGGIGAGENGFRFWYDLQVMLGKWK